MYGKLEQEEDDKSSSSKQDSDSDEAPTSRSGGMKKWVCICCVCCCCLCLVAGGVLWVFMSLAPPTLNVCSMEATAAYNEALSELAKKYAFTEWKGMNWPAVTNAGLSAAQTGDLALAIKQVQGVIPDGHVFASAEPGACTGPPGVQDINVPSETLKKAEIGGGYGMTIAPLDDGTVIVTYVAPGSSAAESGVVAGERVIQLNGVPITQAVSELGEAGWRWARVNPATDDHRLQEQYRAAVRAPIGTVSKWTLTRDLQLTAHDDNYATFDITQVTLPNLPPKKMGEFVFDNQLNHRILPSGYGYIGLGHLEFKSDYMNVFSATMNALAHTPGIIVDIRGNLGGADGQAADFNGFFLPEGSPEVYYEGIEKPALGKMRKYTELKTTPTAPFYTKPVVALINRDTISSGEGIAMGMSRRMRSHVVGFEGTAASFGMAGGRIVFPGDLVLEYPYGRSVDVNGVIQLDSNAQLIGGVMPTVTIPHTVENMQAFIQHKLGVGDDVELTHAEAALRILSMQRES